MYVYVNQWSFFFVGSTIKDNEIARCEDLSLLEYGSLLIHKVTNILKDSWNRKVRISYI